MKMGALQVILTAFAILIQLAKGHIIIYHTNQLIEEFYDLPAQFGATLPSIGLRVLAVQAKPIDGCEPQNKPPSNDPDADPLIKKYVLVIARKNCTFEEKVRNAQLAQYDAAIVFNIGSDDLEQMSAKNGNDITIPSVFVGETTGRYIIEAYDYRSGFNIVINDELPFNINTHLIVPFSILVGLCFIIMISYMIYKCVRERRRLRQHRLPKQLLKKIPTTKFTKGQPYEICVICLDEYLEGEKLRILPCSHAYHSQCVDPWLTKNRRFCPICKRKVFARGESRASRRRQTSSDSMSDTDDDTAPLLNSNTINHGTFSNNTNRNASDNNDANPTSDEENVLQDRNSASRNTDRINPFDRVPNLPPNLASELNSNRSIWNHPIFRIFRRRTFSNINPNNESVTDLPSAEVQHSASVNLPPRPSSNNILNSNLSGSFKEDDNETGQQQSIYEPIGGSTTIVNIPEHDSDSAFIQSSPQGAIGVAALPNTNLNNLTISPNNGHFYL